MKIGINSDKSIRGRRKAQAVVEYFLAFALIIILTVLGFNGAIQTVKDKSKDFFVRKVNDMEPDGSPGGGGEGPPDYDGIPDDGIPLVDVSGRGFQEDSNVYCSAGVPVYYKFVGSISDERHPIQIIGTPYANTGGARSVVLKRGSPPTVAEIEYMNSVGGFDGTNWQQTSRNPTTWGWVVPKPSGYEDTYIRSHSGGYTGIMLEVTKPTPESVWYAAFYSPEDTVLGHVAISVLSN